MDILTLIRQTAENQRTKPAFQCLDSGEVLTYQELMEGAETVGTWLRRRGCRPGERCGFMMADGSEFLKSALGVLSAGLCLAPIAPSLPARDKDRAINAAGLHWLLQAERRLSRLPFSRSVDNRHDEDFLLCKPAYIRFTSGTTGAGKCVLLGHKTIVNRLEAADAVLRIGPDDTVWFALSMTDHFVVSILLYLSRGATIVTSSDVEKLAIPAEEFRPTIFYASPNFYQSLIASRVSRLESVRLAISTTTPLSTEIAQAFYGKFGRRVNPALGIIEVGLLTLNTRPDKMDSVGSPMPAYVVSLIDEDGRIAADNQLGELHVQGPGLLDAYLAPWRPLDQLLSRFGFATGDFARIDQDGYLFLAGRGKNRISIEGTQFFCEEVESVLNRLPGIWESRVFIDPASKLLSAEIVGSAGTIERIPELLVGKIDVWKMPKLFFAVDVLPRTANGKLRRI